jgi:hypothetical protein
MIYIIASEEASARSELDRLRPLLDSNDKVIVALRERDMRGRSVNVGDSVVVVGAWDAHPPHQVEWLVDIFNACRTGPDTVSLKYRAGEGPIVVYPDNDVRNPQKPTTGLRQDGFIYNYQSSTSSTTSIPGPAVPVAVSGGNIRLILDGIPISIERFEVENDPLNTGSMEITATSTSGAAGRSVGFILGKELAEARRDRDAALAQIARISNWMLNVQPVEDPDIPGLYWCAICSRKVTAHESDCPLATAGG